MTHAEIVAAIERSGGRLVASFELDARGRTMGLASRQESNAQRHCGACGEPGHDVKRCMGPGKEPAPNQRDVRGRRVERSIDHDETRRILKDRADARAAARLKR